MLTVQKYGGSSVKDLERIRACAERCLRTRREGGDLVVVVSAMSGETNRLIRLANDLVALGGNEGRKQGRGPYEAPDKAGDADHERELDQLVATGEIVSASLLAMAIQDLGGSAVSLAARQMGMETDGNFTRARIRQIRRERIDRELGRGRIVVCAGFQGIDADDNTTTLGRGGSDTSAVALAAALEADVCEILTDVDGVYTTDPRQCPNARKIDRISYEEMIELASVGAKVLQIRSVEIAMKYSVPVHVRTSSSDAPGTWIVAEESSMENVVVSGVALQRDEAKVTLCDLPDVPGTSAAVFGPLAEAGIQVDMIIQNAGRDGRTDLTFTVPENDLSRATALVGALRLGGGPTRVLTDAEVAKLSVVGVGMRTHAGVAARTFALLASAGINVEMVSTSEIKVSVVIRDHAAEQALRLLHDGFGLGLPPEQRPPLRAAV